MIYLILHYCCKDLPSIDKQLTIIWLNAIMFCPLWSRDWNQIAFPCVSWCLYRSVIIMMRQCQKTRWYHARIECGKNGVPQSVRHSDKIYRKESSRSKHAPFGHDGSFTRAHRGEGGLVEALVGAHCSGLRPVKSWSCWTIALWCDGPVGAVCLVERNCY